MSGEEDSLKTEGDLKDWLVKVRRVDQTLLGEYYITLHRNGYKLKSTLIGITFGELQELNASLTRQKNKELFPLMRHLVNKLAAGSDGLGSTLERIEGQQTNKRSGGDIIEPPLKRTLTDDTDVFFAAFPNGILAPKEAGKLLEFSTKIADTQRTLIFERECFQPLTQKVKELSALQRGVRRQSGIIITGSSGIGKTFFGFFLAYQLIKEGEIVAVNYRNKKRVLFAPTVEELRVLDAKDDRHFLLKLLEKHQQGKLDPLEPEDVNSPRFWGIAKSKDNTLWKQVLANPRTWLLVDLHRNDSYEDGRQNCKIVVTSTLRKGDWPDLDDGGDFYSKKLYMGPLTLEEAKKVLAAADPSISPEDIEKRYKQFGGSARALLNPPDTAQERVNLAFESGSGVGKLLDPNSDNPTTASMLVHIVANEKFEKVGRKFASQEIANRVIDSAILNKELEERVWIEATSGEAGRDIAGTRGIFAERLWHRAVKFQHQVRIKELTPVGQKNAVAEWKQLTMPFVRTRRFTKSDFSDLLDMNVGDYCLPDNSQFPSVDSIAVLAGNPWTSAKETTDATGMEDPKSNRSNGPAPDSAAAPHSSETLEGVASAMSEPIGFMFQMAIGRTHKLANQKTLREIDAKMDDLIEGFTKGESPLYLMYVTETADSFSSNRLNYHKSDGTAYVDAKKLPNDLARIKQFALSFKKLTDG